MDVKECDLAVVGGGPSGLSASLNAASEGLRVIVVESKPFLGGQARTSTRIENYIGFPCGLSGKELIDRTSQQLVQFGVDAISPGKVVSIRREDGTIFLTLEDELQIRCRAVALTLGLSLNRLAAKDVVMFLDRGASYGTPTTPTTEGQCICVVGGANSAGQAAVFLGKQESCRVKLLVRGPGIDDSMSAYLIDRIKNNSRIEVLTETEVVSVSGDDWLETVTVVRHSQKDAIEKIPAAGLYIYIGGSPKTAWLRGILERDTRGYLLTGQALPAWQLKRPPFPFETSMHGVFAAGDVRAGSTKRVSAAVGEGGVVVSQIHQYLRLLDEGRNV